jgi:hypothetical protein
MSTARFARLVPLLREATTEAAWVQWQALGGQVAAREPASIVDPEALILVSLWLKDDEPRFWDLLAGFAQSGSRLLSVQRMRRLVSAFPPNSDARLAVFAQAVSRTPGDPRWRSLAGTAHAAAGRRGKVAAPALRLARPGGLLLRLRTAFGVDVRIDALAYLLGHGGATASVREVAEALGYADNTVRGACDALAAARLASVGPGRPARYHTSAEQWGRLLGLGTMPRWHAWWQGYALALGLAGWLQSGEARRASGAAASALAREWMHDHRTALAALRIEVPDLRDNPGEAFLPVFESTVEALAAWLRGSA